MLDKKTRLAKCLRLQATENIKVQDKPCNETPFSKFKAFCRGCEQKDECSFLGLRGFKISKKTKNLLHGPYFPPTKRMDPLNQLKSARFNAKPPTFAAADYALSKIKTGFEKLLLRQQNASNQGFNTPIRRDNLDNNRHYCDNCFTSLFNYHFVCSSCGFEICPDCYGKLNNNDSNLTICTQNNVHDPAEFVLVSKLSEETMDHLINTTAATNSDITVANIENTNVNNNDTNININKNEDVQNKNDSQNQSTNNFDIQCNYNKSIDIDINSNNNNTTNQDKMNNDYLFTYKSANEIGSPIDSLKTPIPEKKFAVVRDGFSNVSSGIIQEVNTLNYDVTPQIINETNLMDTDLSVVSQPTPPSSSVELTKDAFSPVLKNNLERNCINLIDKSIYVNLPNSKVPSLHQAMDSNYDLMRLPPEFSYNTLVTNHVQTTKRHFEIEYPIMTRRKKRGLEHFTIYHHQHPTSRQIPDIDIMDDNLSYNQSQYDSIPPLPNSNIHYVYPESAIEYDIYNDSRINEEFDPDYSNSQVRSPRVIITPKSRKRHTSLPYSPPEVLNISSDRSTPIPSPQPSPLPLDAPNMLNIPASALTQESFQTYWQSHQPAIITGSIKKSQLIWSPKFFETLCGNDTLQATDIDGRIYAVSGGEYFGAFSNRLKRKELCSSLGSTEVLKIKDFPPNKSLKSVYPELYNDFMKTLITPEYCTAEGYFNLANRLPEQYLPPDLGPKMFISYGSDESGKTGRTNIHCDMTDAVNVMYYADDKTSKVVPIAPALWHIFSFESFEKLSQYIRKYKNVGFLHPILDHAFYLDQDDLNLLKQEYGVIPFTLYQKPGDTVYIPAGCAHQVTNFSNSIKCAYDFISPENIERSIFISDAFKELKKEDKLQLTTTLAFAWTSLESDQV